MDVDESQNQVEEQQDIAQQSERDNDAIDPSEIH